MKKFSLLVLLLFLGSIGYVFHYITSKNLYYGSSFYSAHSFLSPLQDTYDRFVETINTENTEKIYKTAPRLTSKEEYSKKYKQLNKNVPVDLFLNRINYYNSNGCTKFPKIDTLEFSNIYWQTLKLRNKGTVYFYSAYYDNRELVDNAPVIRIMAVINNKDIRSIKYCQIWFSNERKVIISNKTSAIHMDPWNNTSHHYILSCEIPSDFTETVPTAVSLVESECDLATNVLTVHYNLPESGEKENFAICIKALLYPEVDMSFHLIQYIELAKILGIHKIYIYEYMVHPNMSAVLRYYEMQDRIKVTPFTMTGSLPNIPAVMLPVIKMSLKSRFINERVAHNDCFYENIYKYKYIGFFDMDEIMIPSKGKSWKEAIDDVIKKEKEKIGDLYKPPSGYHIPMGYFSNSLRNSWAPEIPKYMSMLQNINRTGMLRHFKQLIDTERNLGISNHEQEQCIGKCILHKLNESEMFLSHYRDKKCTSTMNKINCSRKLSDKRILHYKDDMIKNVDDAVKAIGLL